MHILIQFPLLFKFIIGEQFRAVAMYPFIIVKDKEEFTPVLLQHERIHLRQQLELFLVFFYIIYTAEYLWYRVQYRNHMLAYNQISFEKEAYLMEAHGDYLRKRKAFSMWRRTKLN